MRLFFIIIFLFFSQYIFGQNYITLRDAPKKVKELYNDAYRNSSINNFEKAEKYLLNILQKEPTFIDARMLLANVLYEQKKYEEAENRFEQVLKIDPAFNYRVYYNLALTEKKLKKYSEAVAHLEDYIHTDPSERMKNSAKKHLKSSKFMAHAIENIVPFDPENLGANINTTAHEYLPSFTADGETFIFTRNERRNEDFYTSSIAESGEWKMAQAIEEINTLENEGGQTMTADGRLLIFTGCERQDGIGSCDLYFSVLENGHYTKPKLMPEPINTKYWDSQPSLTPNGDVLYFASKRPNGAGEKDLYVCYFVNGQWTKPRNLGKKINTPADDVTPFIHADGQTLYFTSDGHPGVGKRDLFYTRWQAQEASWGKPENLGIPINTEEDEGTLVLDLSGKMAYFASDRKDFKEAQGGVDLYRFELYEAARPQLVTYVKAVVKDAQTGKPISVDVEITDLTKNRIFTKVQSDESGQFLIVMGAGKNYGLNVEKEGYLFYSDNFALETATDIKDPYLLEILLNPINEEVTELIEQKTEPIILKNVFFETGSADLLPTSINELTKLKELLENTPHLKIQINGHTDSVGSVEDNQLLSSNRAKAIFEWLIEQEISPERLKYKGFGETNPIATNDDAAGRQTNRRTEFVLIK